MTEGINEFCIILFVIMNLTTELFFAVADDDLLCGTLNYFKSPNAIMVAGGAAFIFIINIFSYR